MQKNCSKFEASLGYTMISKPAWAPMLRPYCLQNMLSLGNAITDLFSSLCFLSLFKFYAASILNSKQKNKQVDS